MFRILNCTSIIASRLGPVGYFAPALLALIAVGFMIVRFDVEAQRRGEDNERANVAQQIERSASALRSNINGNIKLGSGLVAAIQSEPAMDQARFARLSEDTLSGKSQIRNIAGAPDLIVRLIYPEEPNRKSLGLDYRTHPRQRDAVLEVTRSSAPIVTGPVSLVQGGSGLIARYPVLARRPDGERYFWGIVSVVMDLQKLFTDSGLLIADSSIDVAISRRSRDGADEIFFGRPALFTQRPVTAEVDLGYDIWTIAALPKQGWGAFQQEVLSSRIFSFFVASAIAGPFLWIGYLLKQRQRHVVSLSEREEELETLSHRLQLALEASKIGVWEFDTSTGELNWDGRMRELYSVSPDKPACDYNDWRLALHPDDVEVAERQFASALAEGSNYNSQFRVMTEPGGVRHIKAFGLPYRSLSGALRFVGANADVTEDVRMQEQLRAAHARAEEQNQKLEEASRRLEHQSFHDALTGLPNRRFLDRYLEKPALQSAHVLAHLDLDRFKEVNDTLGHPTGDAVLQEAATRMLSTLRAGEFAARIGGDEFVVVAPTNEPENRSRELGVALNVAFSEAVAVNGFECQMATSIGIAAETRPGSELRQLLANADFALYEAKRLGRNRVRYFDENLKASAASFKRSTEDLLRGISHSEFIPFFQPQFDAKNFDIVGVEALARWDHPERGLLTPDKFLPLAESLNKVFEIDQIIFEKSLFQSARWASLAVRRPKLSVNISAQRLRDERLARRLSDLNVAPGSLAFELLESISFDGRDEDLVGTISRLKQLGAEIEIDDFGSGHASITSLLEIAPKRLKIDRKIVLPVVESVPHQRLVAAVVEIGKSFDIEITAEGVETMAHARILGDLGCQTLQGYAFAKPMSSDEFIQFQVNRRAGANSRGLISA